VPGFKSRACLVRLRVIPARLLATAIFQRTLEPVHPVEMRSGIVCTRPGGAYSLRNVRVPMIRAFKMNDESTLVFSARAFL
jgi:hypothetical protein